jgi:hypothetical protein
MPAVLLRYRDGAVVRSANRCDRVVWSMIGGSQVNDIIYIALSLGVFLGLFAVIFGFTKV